MDDWQLVSKYRSLPSPSGPPTLPPTPRVPKKKKTAHWSRFAKSVGDDFPVLHAKKPNMLRVASTGYRWALFNSSEICFFSSRTSVSARSRALCSEWWRFPSFATSTTIAES
jgi:hypothetical protein